MKKIAILGASEPHGIKEPIAKTMQIIIMIYP